MRGRTGHGMGAHSRTRYALSLRHSHAFLPSSRVSGLWNLLLFGPLSKAINGYFIASPLQNVLVLLDPVSLNGISK